MTTSANKIAAVRIELNRREGETAEAVFEGGDVWIKAAARLQMWSLTAPANGCYDKTDFVVHFENGEKYTGRVDLTRDDSETDLAEHVRSFLGFYAGTNRPAHMTEAEYRRCLSRFTPEEIASTAEYLETHAIG